ncbi:6-carboxytetrahydropterin synthase [Vulcanococcus limneticus]|uniref:6-carboxytetrahydropterin synthase n=1 Tax=Vulcanococcus limneticus TaxID=2170428 RepID=UPI00398BC74D
MTERQFYVASARFEAARRVTILPEGHRSRRLHGHSFLARARVESPVDWAPFPGGEAEALHQALNHCVKEIDYCYLNEHLSIPTDENLARWLRVRLNLTAIESLGIQSTINQGADIDWSENVHIWRRFRFEAAHQLPNVPEGHKCGRMHGHGFEVILHANQDLGADDMGIDFDCLAEVWAPFGEDLNYSCLNEKKGLENPTSEMLAAWLWAKIKPSLPSLSWITVYETSTAGCHYDGQHYRIWKEFRFESALSLEKAPVDDPRHRLHGHSYTMRLHLCAPLDSVAGWTVDYGDVKELFRPVYNQIDHHCLMSIPRLDHTDSMSLAQWIRRELASKLPQLDRIDLYQTPGCGVSICWGDVGPALPS